MTADLNDPQAREARRLERTRQRIRASRAKWSSVRSNLGASILTAMLAGAKQTLQADVAYCREARDNVKLSKSDRATAAAVVAGAHLNDLLGAALDAFVDMKRERRLEYLHTYISAVQQALAASGSSDGPAVETPAGHDDSPQDVQQAAHDEPMVSSLDDLAVHLADTSATDGSA